MVGWRRVLAVLGVAAAGVLLSGCHLEGGADVISTDDATLDLLVSDFDFECVSSDDPTSTVRVTAGQDASGNATCRITGTLPLSNLGFSEFRSSEVGEYWVFDGTFVDGRSEWPDAEVEVHFPGDVVESSQGTIKGNTLVLNPGKLTSNELRVIVLNRPGPATWVIAAGVGAASGAVLTLAVLGLLRRARRIRGAPAVVDPPVVGPAALPALGESAAAAATAEGSAAAPATAEESPTAPSTVARPLAEPVPVPVDHSWLAAPPEPPEAVLEPPPAAEEPPDHSMWAPPDER